MGWKIRYVSDYKTNDRWRGSFNRLARSTFGIDFEEWYRRGFWNDRYICHSFVDGDEVAANVSASRMKLVVNGRLIRAVQLGTVMTRPDYRGQGLSARLMHEVMEAYKQQCEVFYLFANASVREYYPKFGYRPVMECRFSWKPDLPLQRSGWGLLRKLNPRSEPDLRLIAKLAEGRSPVSRLFGVEQGESIFMWHAMNVYPDRLYYGEEDHVLLVAGWEDADFHVYDLLAAPTDSHRCPELIRKLLPREARNVIFHFTPDLLGLDGIMEEAGRNTGLFVKGEATPFIPDGLRFTYPVTAQT